MKNIADRLTIEEHNHQHYVFVDYTGLKEKEMIELVILHGALTLREKIPFLADFHNTFATPNYVLQAKKFIELTKEVVDKAAFLGIDSIKLWIFKGAVMTYGVNYHAFETKEQAIDFLTRPDD